MSVTTFRLYTFHGVFHPEPQPPKFQLRNPVEAIAMAIAIASPTPIG